MSSICLNGFMSSRETATPASGPDAGQRVDGRREGGSRTRRRLIETAQELLAKQGEDAIRLRELTAAAQVNVAAVHYHFGSLRALFQVAETEAVEHIVDAQLAELAALGAGATLRDIAAAYFRPVVQALSGPSGPGRPYLGVLGRLAAGPPPELREWVAATIQRAHDGLLASLRAVLPDVPDAELRFRVKCVGGIIVELGGWALEPDLRGKTPQQVEELLVPVVAGALAGG
jgi:AcrR family transcriptional regulator